MELPTVFEVRATACKKRFLASIASENPLIVKVEIPAVAEKGKANRALLLGLEGLLGCRVELLSGATGRKKTLAADCNKDDMVEKIKMNQKIR
jgi:uncharacterized protein YggU (UPF0235/DUF167 family)